MSFLERFFGKTEKPVSSSKSFTVTFVTTIPVGADQGGRMAQDAIQALAREHPGRITGRVDIAACNDAELTVIELDYLTEDVDHPTGFADLIVAFLRARGLRPTDPRISIPRLASAPRKGHHE